MSSRVPDRELQSTDPDAAAAAAENAKQASQTLETQSPTGQSGDPVAGKNSRCLNPRTQAPAIRRGLLFRRHYRHTLIARAQLLRGGREIQQRAAFVGAAAGDHQPVGTGHDVTL